MPLPTTPYRLATDDDLEEFFQLVSEEALQACVLINRRLWLVTEDDHGDFWAWSIPEDDDEAVPMDFEELWSETRTTPVTVLHLEPF